MRLFQRPTVEEGFWKWFQQNASALSQTKDFEGPLFSELSNRLASIRSGLVWELALHGKERELTISADGDRQLFPVVKKLVASAPSIPGWRVNAFRQRRPLDFAYRSGNTSLAADAIKFALSGPRDGKMDIDLYIDNYGKGDEQIPRGAFILLDAAIGEYDMETKIGAIDFRASGEVPIGVAIKPLRELASTLDASLRK